MNIINIIIKMHQTQTEVNIVIKQTRHDTTDKIKIKHDSSILKFL